MREGGPLAVSVDYIGVYPSHVSWTFFLACGRKQQSLVDIFSVVHYANPYQFVGLALVLRLNDRQARHRTQPCPTPETLHD